MDSLRHARRPTPRWWLARIAVAVVAGLALAMAVDLARGGVTAIWLRYGGAVAYMDRDPAGPLPVSRLPR